MNNLILFLLSMFISGSVIAESENNIFNLLNNEIKNINENPFLPDEYIKKMPKKSLKLGSSGSDFNAFKEILLNIMGPDESINNSLKFDKVFESKVKSLQNKYNLDNDGIADSQLYFNLKLNNLDKIKLLEKTDEIYKKISNDAEINNNEKYIVVNIPSFSLKGFNKNNIDFESKVIIGRPNRKTPVLKMNITGLKYNPDWSPPPTIIKKNILPSLDGDGAWVKNHGLIAIDKSSGEEIDISDIDSSDIESGNVRLYQPSGRNNALGLLKFETDSRDNIYLHDTNERHLFEKSYRAASSGCIRVNKWLELASWYSNQKMDAIEEKINKGKMYVENLNKVPVYVIYTLADVVNKKAVFYPDIYNKLN